MIQDIWEDGWFGKLFLLGVPILFVLMIAAFVVDANQWEQFRMAHNCQVVGKMRGDVTTTVAPIVGGNGGVAIGTSVSPDKTGWKCDDGITYWR